MSPKSWENFKVGAHIAVFFVTLFLFAQYYRGVGALCWAGVWLGYLDLWAVDEDSSFTRGTVWPFVARGVGAAWVRTPWGRVRDARRRLGGGR